ncbi:MAG: Ktr system potassium uptake protein [Verrucomicrobiota bacterium]|jgi:trk system potassium uptake protein TrkA
MKYAVIGLGDFGRAVALGLARAGSEVIAIDRNMDRLNAVKDEVTLAVRLDSTQRDALESQDIGSVDALVAAIGENFESQVLTVVHAKNLKIPRIVARASSEDHRRVLEAIGANEIFYPEEEAARNIVQRLTLSNIKNYFELAEGFSLVEVQTPTSAVGKTLKELNLRNEFRINLVAVKSFETDDEGKQVLKRFDPVPSPDQQLQQGDVLALVGSVLDLANFLGDSA